jgi:hypothetical protein
MNNVAHDCDKNGCGLYCKTTRQRRFDESQLLAKIDLAIKRVADLLPNDPDKFETDNVGNSGSVASKVSQR